MRKLRQGQVVWIINEMERGERSVHSIAKRVGVTPRWVRELWYRSESGRVVPVLRPPGRPSRGVSDEETAFIIECEKRFRLHSQALERKIMDVHGRHVPHNRIWAVLKEARLVSNTPAKQKRRKAWVRFERRHSNSLWQMDFSELRPGDWLLVIIDDASRLVPGHARAKSPTAKLAWDTFLMAGERDGFPRQILTDHGTQFTKEQYDAEGYFDRKLKELEKERGIHVQHIRGRVKHPQTGGKVERVIGTIKSKLWAEWPDGTKQFRDLDDVVQWYNEVKPHASLRFEEAETPSQAFVRKLRPKERRAFLKRHKGGRR